MAERSNVPKFGNWEGEENVPYTAYFEKARKGRAAPGSRVTNPNDPEYNSTKPEEVVDHPVRKSREGTRSREESELKQFGGGGDGSGSSSNEKRQGKSSQNNSYDNKSPLHKNSYDAGAGRSKPKPNLRPDESPEKVTVVPKFGDWDENNPASADGYTHIFNKVREERSTGANNVSGSSRTPTHASSRNSPSSSSKCCCFGFGGK